MLFWSGKLGLDLKNLVLLLWQKIGYRGSDTNLFIMDPSLESLFQMRDYLFQLA